MKRVYLDIFLNMPRYVGYWSRQRLGELWADDQSAKQIGAEDKTRNGSTARNVVMPIQTSMVLAMENCVVKVRLWKHISHLFIVMHRKNKQSKSRFVARLAGNLPWQRVLHFTLLFPSTIFFQDCSKTVLWVECSGRCIRDLVGYLLAYVFFLFGAFLLNTSVTGLIKWQRCVFDYVLVLLLCANSGVIQIFSL